MMMMMMMITHDISTVSGVFLMQVMGNYCSCLITYKYAAYINIQMNQVLE